MPGALVGAWLHGMAGLRARDVAGTTASVVAGDVLAEPGARLPAVHKHSRAGRSY